MVTSCGYRAGAGPLWPEEKSVSIPYVSGDLDGGLTAALVYELSGTLNFNHTETGGQLVLIVKVVDVDIDNIGFRYEQLHSEKYKRSIIPIEARMSVTAQVSLIDASTQCLVLPTVQLTSFVELDHEYNATFIDSTVFSLGQLSDSDAAFAAARPSLNRTLARKIIDYISLSSWSGVDVSSSSCGSTEQDVNTSPGAVAQAISEAPGTAYGVLPGAKSLTDEVYKVSGKVEYD